MSQFLIISLSLFISACQTGVDASLLEGNWQGVHLTEEGEVVDVPLEETKFSFTEDGRYGYESNLNYKEAGTYFMDGKFLVSTDTLVKSTAKSVLIEFLSQDSMAMRMNDEGKTRILELVKVKN